MFQLKIGDTKVDIKARKAEYKNLKLKLANVLCSAPFCCLCLNTSYLNSLNAPVYFKNWESNYFVTMKHVLNRLFNEKVTALPSNHICGDCKDSSLNNYVFLINTERTLEIIEDYVNQLDQQAHETGNLIESKEDKFANIVFVMKDPMESKLATLTQDKDVPIEDAEKREVVNIKLESCHDNSSDEDAPSEDIGQKVIKNRKYKCNICDKKLKTKPGIRYHMKVVHRVKFTKYSCPECGENDCCHRQFLEPIEKVQRKSCIACEYVCWSKTSLISHVNKEHLHIKPYMCELCAKQLHSLLAYKQHKRFYHTKHYSCLFCETKFSNKQKLEKHESLCKRTEREFKCQRCLASFVTQEKLSIHLKKHDNELPCDSCDKVFSSEIALSRHKLMHSKTVVTLRRTLPICTICHIEFGTRRDRNNHMREHSVDDKHWCLHCNLEFDTAKAYQAHTATPAHVALAGFNKTFCCPHCDYVARAEFVLEAHINRQHLKQAPYKCSECDKAFTTAFNLKCHLKVHTKVNITKKKYECSLCERVFCGPTALKKHVRLHTGERPYSCEVCGDGFVSSSMLKMHQKSRHAEKNIQCPLCTQLFCALSYMRMHVKKAHWTLNEKFDIRKIEGLTEEQYDMFRDRRQLVLQ